MYMNQKVIDLIDSYYFVVPNENHAEAFTRAKRYALQDINEMRVQDFKSYKDQKK